MIVALSRLLIVCSVWIRVIIDWRTFIFWVIFSSVWGIWHLLVSRLRNSWRMLVIAMWLAWLIILVSILGLLYTRSMVYFCRLFIRHKHTLNTYPASMGRMSWLLRHVNMVSKYWMLLSVVSLKKVFRMQVVYVSIISMASRGSLYFRSSESLALGGVVIYSMA